MNKSLWEKAVSLAGRSYTVNVTQDETTKGEPVFVARSPELPGCMGQGKTIEESVADLSNARIDYIFSLLEDGIAIPEPYSVSTYTGSGARNSIEISFEIPQKKEPSSHLYEASLKPM